MIDSKECIVCFEEINLKAKKCTRCDSFQDFRRFIDIGNTSISMLVALITVITLLITTLQKAGNGSEEVTINVIESGRTELALTIANSGGEVAAVSPNPTLANSGIKAFSVSLVNDTREASTDLVIKPNELQVMKVTYPSGYVLKKITSNQCEILLKVMKIDGESRLAKTKFPCEFEKL